VIHRLYCYRLTRRVPLVEKDMPTLPEHLSSPPDFSGVLVMRSLVLYVCFVDRCLPFCTFSFGHCVVCSSSIYGFWLPLWYLQTLLAKLNYQCFCLVVFIFLLLHVYFLYIYNQWNTRIQHQYANKTGQIMLQLTFSAYGPQTLSTTLPSFGLCFFL
jgi:hypothetical protein